MTRGNLSVWVPDVTRGKDRPRATRTGRMYTPATTREAEEAIRFAWRRAGMPSLPDGPIVVDVVVKLARPKKHYLKSGLLNAEGERHPIPLRKPDVDNVLKLALDALNGLAWRDDALVVRATVERRWGNPGLSIDARSIA